MGDHEVGSGLRRAWDEARRPSHRELGAGLLGRNIYWLLDLLPRGSSTRLAYQSKSTESDRLHCVIVSRWAPTSECIES